ncbi:MAG TPA: histidine kinase [Candidatus Acidoferrales bacterium]|nr:histidine kinase [Candidatus Acidoferrales bacterium]
MDKKFVASIVSMYSRGPFPIFLFGVLTVVALVVAMQQFYIINYNTVTRYDLIWHVPFNLFYFWYWFTILPIMYWIIIDFKPRRYNALYWTFLYFLMPIGIVLIHQVIASVTINLFLGYSDFFTLVYKRVVRNPWVGMDLTLYFAIMIAINIVEYQQKNKADELRLAQLQAQLVQSQLSALESQLHPHFLFNTLNAVSTLILKRENREAERMLRLLHEFLKSTIYQNERHEITFREEVRFIRQYLEIEKVRYKDRMEIELDIGEETLDVFVPNLLLQPVLENAIRYAVAARKSKGIVKITSKLEDGRLKIMVEDNGPGLVVPPEKKSREGLGLKITKERLAHFCGDKYLFELEPSSLGGLKVRMEIPFVKREENSYGSLVYSPA